MLQTPQKESPRHVRKLGLTRRRERRAVIHEENPEEKAWRHKESELKPLYMELLYTIEHRLGAPSCPGAFTQTQLQGFIQEAFTMTKEEHRVLTEKVQNTEPPVYCLMAIVKEAKGILGKDVSGFSDPYCLLTIIEDQDQTRSKQSRSKAQKSVVKTAALDKTCQTDVKKQTLNPVWNETFILEFADVAAASFHLEMWDKDEEVSLSQKLEEIKTLNSLKRMIKDAKKEKGTDDFLGRVSLKLQDLHCVEDRWYDLEPKTETYPDRGQCHLNLKFIHKSRDGTLSAGRSAYINFCGVLQQFVQAHISSQQSGSSWRGELCGEAQVLLELYASQNDLSPFLQDLGKWVAYSKLYQSLEVDSCVLLQQLTSIEYHWHQQELPQQQKQELGDSLHGFLQYGLCLLSKYRDIFPPTPTATPKLHTLLRILVQICKTQAFQTLNPSHFELHEEVTDALRTGTDDWFSVKKGLHQPMTKELSETVGALSRLIREVQEDIRHNKDVYNRVFVSAVQVDVFTIVYHKFDSLLAQEVRDTLRLTQGHMDQDLATSLFSVYLSLQKIHQDKAFLQKRGLLELTHFHELFREALPHWLQTAFSTTQQRVERAVHVDQLQPLQSGTVPIKHSSSAVDLVSCVQPICQLWETLGWPDPEEAFMLMVKLTEDVCKIVVNYCKLLKERVRELTENSEYGSSINMLCVVVNDLEHLRSMLSRLPSQLNWAGLRERTQHVIGERQFNNTLPSQLQQAQDVLGREIRSALHTLGRRLNTDIETHVRSMATRKRIPSKSTEDVAAPLMRYLEKELQYMNKNLVQENFNSLLTPLWNNSLRILLQVVSQPQHQDGFVVYCQRLKYTLQCLEQCFYAEGNGLPNSILHSADYKTLEGHLKENSLSSFELLEKFFVNKITEQKVFSGERFGAVTLLAVYQKSERKLRVEVLNAVNLLPLDSNGLSDPFVQLSLEPSHIFPALEPRCTQIKSHDLNPLFDEVFDFVVSEEQCRSPGACLWVTVLDHDTLRKDDFEGEAFLSLKFIPGVAETKNNEDIADVPPAQIRLPLMHPSPNEDSVLKLLESRRGEREAQAFVKKRRLREKQSQKNISS